MQVKEEIEAVTDKVYEARGKAGDARVRTGQILAKQWSDTGQIMVK